MWKITFIDKITNKVIEVTGIEIYQYSKLKPNSEEYEGYAAEIDYEDETYKYSYKGKFDVNKTLEANYKNIFENKKV
jgi:hypothetical protein